MFLYIIIEAIIGIIACVLLAVGTKKKDDVVYGKLDKIGKTTNALLLVGYVFLSPLYLGVGIISYPSYEGFLGLIGWIVSIINASVTLFCCLGIGFSVALRKKGKSKLSFAVQFAGLAAIVLAVAMYCIFAGNLLVTIN